MENLIIILILVLILGGAVLYIYKSKKQGVKCVGCPYANTCSNKAKTNCESGCNCDLKNE